MKHNPSAKLGKKTLVVILTAALLVSSVSSATAFAAETTVKQSETTTSKKTAQKQGQNTQNTANTPKEEVVYANLASDGKVSDGYVVNSFEMKQDGQIIDYGTYSALRNMTSSDEIHQDNGKITITTKAGKLYYEGKLDKMELPWTFSFHYYLDGKEYTAEELAGKSGALKITMAIRKNPACKGNFFDDYALQATVTLDSEKAKTIKADDATIANVGSDKQLTYTILPGKKTDITITADVTNFEMKEISINGIRLNMNVEVDDKKLMDQVKKLQDGISQLDDGASKLKDGTETLEDGAQSKLPDGTRQLMDGAAALQIGASQLNNGGTALQSGTFALKKGADSLEQGAKALNDGILQVQDGLEQLDSQSANLTQGSAQIKGALQQIQSSLANVSATSGKLDELVAGSGQIQSGIQALVSGASALQQQVSFASYKAAMAQNGLDIDALYAGNAAAAQNISQMVETLRSQVAALQQAGGDPQQIAQLQAQIEQLSQVSSLLAGSNAAIDGMGAYLGTVQSGLQNLLDGATALKTNYQKIDAGIQQLSDSLATMVYQMSELSGAIDQLVTEYGKLDTGINSYTGGVAQILSGYDQLTDGSAQLAQGAKKLSDGSDSLYGGTSDLLSGLVDFYNATGSLKDGTGKLDDGVAELLAGIVALRDGAGELQDGTAEMKDETKDMDQKVEDQIDELLKTITGGDSAPESFVSSRNQAVESVQFVIKTGSIAIPEPEDTPTEQADPSIWEKFLMLFGWKKS
ncbi:MAG: hypothetical protein PUC32_07430 [Oscillospiraceae bacterium]|nr:hypothetical protein [Oscillospiraceae bacterium]